MENSHDLNAIKKEHIEQEQETHSDHDDHHHTLTPKRSKKLVVGIFFLFVILFVGIIAYVFGRYKSQKIASPNYESGVLPTRESNPVETQKGKIFSSNELTFQYPDDFTEDTNQGSFDQSTTTLVTLVSKKSELFAPNYSQESIMVISSVDRTSECLKTPQNGEISQGEKNIGGYTFTVFSLQDAGAGNRYDSTFYRIVHNNTCFEIAQTVHSSSDWNGINQNEYQASVEKAKTEMASILETLIFFSTQPTNEIIEGPTIILYDYDPDLKICIKAYSQLAPNQPNPPHAFTLAECEKKNEVKASDLNADVLCSKEAEKLSNSSHYDEKALSVAKKGVLNKCYFDMAVAKKDKNLCEKIDSNLSTSLKGECISDISSQSAL